MSKRIEELDNQAYEYAEQVVEYHRGGDFEYKTALHEVARQKFAELIVKECAKVAVDYVASEQSKLVETVEISRWRLQVAIEEHFGVE